MVKIYGYDHFYLDIKTLLLYSACVANADVGGFRHSTTAVMCRRAFCNRETDLSTKNKRPSLFFCAHTKRNAY